MMVSRTISPALRRALICAAIAALAACASGDAGRPAAAPAATDGGKAASERPEPGAEDAKYYEIDADGNRRVREEYRRFISNVCATPIGACPIYGGAVLKGEPCSCLSPRFGGRFWGHAL